MTQLQIKKLLNDAKKSGLGFEMRNKMKIIMLDMFDKAIIDSFAKRNPVKGIKLVRDEETERRVLTLEDQAAFFDCAKGTFYDNMFTAAVQSGLRPGELFALTEEDIDFAKHEIQVTKTLLYQTLEGDDKKTFHLNPPKKKKVTVRFR
jgi:integrase